MRLYGQEFELRSDRIFAVKIWFLLTPSRRNPGSVDESECLARLSKWQVPIPTLPRVIESRFFASQRAGTYRDVQLSSDPKTHFSTLQLHDGEKSILVPL
jgi:hypothetical protein